MPPEILAVGGAKGVGKTTALKELQKSPQTQVVYVSAELNRFSLTKNSKRLSALHISERDEVRKEYGEGLAEKLTKSSDNKVYVDLHYTDIREDPDKILHPALFLSIVNYFIIMTADLEVIHERRSAGTTRKRELNLEKIKTEQDSELNCVTRLAHRYGKTLTQINAALSIAEIISLLLKIPKSTVAPTPHLTQFCQKR